MAQIMPLDTSQFAAGLKSAAQNWQQQQHEADVADRLNKLISGGGDINQMATQALQAADPASLEAINRFISTNIGLAEIQKLQRPPREIPKIQEFYQGQQVVQKQWNPQSGTWDVVGEGPRFKPGPEGGVITKPGKGQEWRQSPDGGWYIGEKLDKVADSAVEKIAQSLETVKDSLSTAATFRPEYGGRALMGGMSTTVGRIAGDVPGIGASPEAVDWWSRFKMLENKKRNEMYGASLTTGEERAWGQTSATERDNPDYIARKARERAVLLASAHNARLESLRRSKRDIGGMEYIPFDAQMIRDYQSIMGGTKYLPSMAPDNAEALGVGVGSFAQPQAAPARPQVSPGVPAMPQGAQPKKKFKYNPATGRVE